MEVFRLVLYCFLHLIKRSLVVIVGKKSDIAFKEFVSLTCILGLFYGVCFD